VDISATDQNIFDPQVQDGDFDGPEAYQSGVTERGSRGVQGRSPDVVQPRLVAASFRRDKPQRC
jgi:hypothetical protein